MASRNNVVQIVKGIKEDIGLVTGFEVLSVVSLARAEEGWEGRVEVTELQRTPDTQDLVGVYEVVLNSEGNLISWERLFSRVKGAPLRFVDVPE
jgi:hypothetical protein